MPKDISDGSTGEGAVIRASIRTYDSMRRSAIKGEGGIAVERGGITLIPSTKARWNEKHIAGEDIFDLRADGKDIWFETPWHARDETEAVREASAVSRYAASSEYLWLKIRPKNVPALGIVRSLPQELGRPRCRKCGTRCPADGACPSCGQGFQRSFRMSGLVKLGWGVGSVLLAILLGWILSPNMKTGVGKGIAVMLAILGLGGTILGAIGTLTLVLGPRFRLFFLKGWGVFLIVALILGPPILLLVIAASR